jgi:hypothetical protein
VESATVSGNDRLNSLEAFTSSLDDNFVNELELASATGSLINLIGTKLDTGSYNTDSSSFDSRLDSLETESGSIRNEFNLFTQSIDTEQSTQNNRLDLLSTESGSIRTTLNTYTESNDSRVLNIELFTSSIDTTIKTKLDIEGVVSSSSQIQIESVSGFTTYSSSIDSQLSSLKIESGSIRTTFNQFTSSYNTGSFTGSFIGDLVGNSSTSTSASYALTASYIDGGFY